MPQHRHFEVGTLQSPKGAGHGLTLFYARQQFHIHFKLAQARTSLGSADETVLPSPQVPVAHSQLHSFMRADKHLCGQVGKWTGNLSA